MAGLYLFRTSRFYPLTPHEKEPKTYLAPKNSGITKPIVPSEYVNDEQLSCVKELCDSYDGYILCPLYTYGDYQLLITEKSIYQVDADEEATVIRGVSEEAGIRPFSMTKTSLGYNICVKNCEQLDPSDNLYGNFQSLSNRNYLSHKIRYKKLSKKINVVIYGQRDSFMKLYKGVKINRPKFAEPDIIGFLLIPTNKVF